jgi:hypothetical protein
MPNTLPVNRIVNVGIVLSPKGAQAQSTSDLLVMGTSSVIDPTERYRLYATLTAVANDFGTSAMEYLAAQTWFGQSPQPTRLYIGRWVNAAASGGLKCGLLTSTQQLLASWQAITTGGFKLAKDGGALTNYTGLNFSAAANLNAVAAIIQAALAGVTVVWNSVYSRFEFTSTTTGSASAIAFLTAPTAGTDISAMLAGLSTSGGAYVYAGANIETAVAAAQVFDNAIGQKFYALACPAAATADHLAIAGFVQGATNKHIYAVTSNDATIISTIDTTSIAYLLQQLTYNRTMVQYSSQNPYAALSALARILTTDYNANSTVITLKFKQEPGVVYENLTASQATAAESKNANVFVQYDNLTAILEQGVMSDGTFIDIMTSTDWLAITIQNALYNLLYTSTTKIPQTDSGQQLLTSQVEAICSQAVINGMLAPGVWNSNGFGLLKQTDYLQKGYYVYSAPYATQLQSDRAARHAMPIQCAVKLAGAIHDINVIVNVNQ